MKRQGVGDLNRAAFRAHYAAVAPSLTTAEKLEAMRKFAESERLDRIDPFAAARYREANAPALAHANAIVDAVKESGSEMSTGDVIALLETSK